MSPERRARGVCPSGGEGAQTATVAPKNAANGATFYKQLFFNMFISTYVVRAHIVARLIG